MIIGLFSQEKKGWISAILIKIRFNWEKPSEILGKDMNEQANRKTYKTDDDPSTWEQL